MRKCVVLYNSIGNVNVSILNDSMLVVNFVGDYSLDKFLTNTKIDELDVIYKPVIANTVPENGYKIGNITVDSLNKSCIVSAKDVSNLVDICSANGITSLNVYNYMDVVADKFKSHSSVIVVSEWANDLVGLFYIEYGVIIDFKKTNEAKLSVMLSKFRGKYPCEVRNDSSNYDYVDSHSIISNLDKVESHKKVYTGHLPYVLIHKGISQLEGKPKALITGDEEYGIPTDNYEDSPNGVSIKKPTKEKKPGFFARLFGKKPKSIIEPDEDEDEDDEMDDYHFSQVARGRDRLSHTSYGKNLNRNARNSVWDLVFYTVTGVIFTCMILGTGLSFVYKSKVGSLSTQVDTLSSIKNRKEANLSIKTENGKSPSTIVSSLKSTKVPSDYKILDVNYKDGQYDVGVKVLAKGASIDKVTSYLPKDLIVSNVKEVTSDDNNKNYVITLISP